MKNRARPGRSRTDAPKISHRKDIRQDNIASLIDTLTAFEDFRTEIFPALRRDLASGMTAKELREKYAAMAQARLISEAITSVDAGKATASAQDIINRVEGKATEKKEVTHRFKDLSDEELDAVLKSEEEDLSDLEQRFDQ